MHIQQQLETRLGRVPAQQPIQLSTLRGAVSAYNVITGHTAASRLSSVISAALMFTLRDPAAVAIFLRRSIDAKTAQWVGEIHTLSDREMMTFLTSFTLDHGPIEFCDRQLYYKIRREV